MFQEIKKCNLNVSRNKTTTKIFNNLKCLLQIIATKLLMFITNIYKNFLN